ncbi:hypothetical protein [Halobacillus salinus]|uniref:hypothetical protein n=1 Tax=Halobacillus salinus TaxID=192814 RepID=UPI001456B7D9|nr:hypothetical protein [Halobacillus salinus]
MNVDVLILFLNCILTTVVSSVVVIYILRKQYKPAIKKLEEEEQDFTQFKDNQSANG